jgi:multisubunit Na+/H+ antiporter MnhG subunit
MKAKKKSQYRTLSFFILLVGCICIVLSNILFKIGTTQHLLISLFILVLSVIAYFLTQRSNQ